MYRKAKIYGALLLLLLLGQMVGTSFFPHVHIVEGKAIIHSHPYSGSPKSPGHGHGNAQFALIALLSATVMIVASMWCSIDLTARRVLIFVDRNERFQARSACSHIRLRGPPAIA